MIAGMRRLLVLGLAIVVPLTAAAEEASSRSFMQRLFGAPAVVHSPTQANTEQQLPDVHFVLWTLDPDRMTVQADDRIVLSNRRVEDVSSTEMKELVPLIHDQQGAPAVPSSALQQVRDVLERLGTDKRLRMRFTGYTDSAPLTPEQRTRYGDRVGLSRARAQAAADYFRSHLALPESAMTVEGKGDANPLETGDTPEVRALNRRVEVQVWVDTVESKGLIPEPLAVPPPGVRRVRVCRTQPACILVRKLPGTRKVELRNVVPPIHLEADEGKVSRSTLDAVRDVFARYRDKPNVQLRITAYTDGLPIGQKAQALYGDRQGLTAAQARWVATQIRRQLGLADHQVVAQGGGADRPLADGRTVAGRARNRRVEVDLWYDAPAGVISVSGMQTCPVGDEGREMVSQPYRPGEQDPLPAIPYRNGKPEIGDAFLTQLKGLLDRLQDKPNLHLRFVGYLAPTSLSRRAAQVYGDAWKLSEDRAERVRKKVQEALKLPDAMLQTEGGGYAPNEAADQSDLTTAPQGQVVAQIWFDVPAPRSNEEVEVVHTTRDTSPVNPYSLAPLRVTVDGKRLDDTLPDSADVQRCTDVALDKTRIQLSYDGSAPDPKLAVSAWPTVIATRDDPDTPEAENLVRFRSYSNYAAYLSRSEVRLFRVHQPLSGEPLAVIPLDRKGDAEWHADEPASMKLKFVLRVYDKLGHYDETKPQSLWLVSRKDLLRPTDAQVTAQKLAQAYGANQLQRQDIPLDGSAVTVHGEAVPAGHQVWVMGTRTPVDKKGKFVSQQIVPDKLLTAEVAVLDAAGNGELYQRDLSADTGRWYYVGIADFTIAQDNTTGPASLVTGDTTHYNSGTSTDGRLAFYLKGKTRHDVEITASADTQEMPLGELFTSFLDKNPQALLRRLDADYYYPTYGDESNTIEDAPTQGKFYLKAKKDDDFAVWGNFKAEWLDTDLARVDRGMYGAYGHYESKSVTKDGKRKTRVDGFAAEPGTVRAREEFRGTGGSLYFLHHQDITLGSESVWVEVRDPDSGLVLNSHRLTPGTDYDIDAIQGRIQLTSPLPSTADGSVLVQSSSLSGDPVFLVVHYEYVPGFDQLNDVAYGGRASHWFGDHVKLGVTATAQDQLGQSQTLGGADLTLRKDAGTYVKLESAATQGPGLGEQSSLDGGYTFTQVPQDLSPDAQARANRVEAVADLHTLSDKLNGRVTTYYQQRGAGYSAPGQVTLKDTEQYGGTFDLALGKKKTSALKVKMDARDETLGLSTQALSADLSHPLGAHWTVVGGVRHDDRQDNSTVVPVTQTEGSRTDGAVKFVYDSKKDWKAYGFGQVTAEHSGTRDANNRLGFGGDYKTSKRLSLHGEVSDGDLGPAAKAGAEYMLSDKSKLYSTYALDNERDDFGVQTEKGTFTSGFRTQTSQKLSIYGEEKYTYGDVPTGLTHAYGVDFGNKKGWRFGASTEVGTLVDNLTHAPLDRTAFSLSAGRTSKAMTYAGALEYRTDKTSTDKRATWLLKNRLSYRTSPDWTFIGKLNVSDSTSTQGEFYAGRFAEGVLGYAYRPVENDRFNALAKYTYFYNLPSPDQVSAAGVSADYVQRSQIVSLDAVYDLTRRWSLGAKYAYRFGEMATDRSNPVFFNSRGQLIIVRADWHFVRQWDMSVEARQRNEIDAGDSRSGALFGIYRHLGNHVKMGIGYNFTDFSDDLTNLDFNSQGFFINVVGKF
jgi:flagellar motor protein MotB